jgi:uncharacterized protein YmfQ (DUF2313 family)
MGNAQVLQQLFPPIPIAGVLEDDFAVDGACLDAAQASAANLLLEMFPDTSVQLLASWERICGLVPPPGATVRYRQGAVVQKLRATPGDIKRPYFIALAATLGYTITITPCLPFMSGWGRAGDSIFIANAIYIWIVTISGEPVYYFQSGQSWAGETLCWWPPQTALQNLLTSLKPADVVMVFAA